ncbi:MAG: hypothetical protein ACJ78Q_17090 [Chloroflexia bacterium]
MTNHQEQPTSEIPIACKLSGPELAAWGLDVTGMLASAEDITELPNGYAFRYPATSEWAATLLSFIISERACCPFFTFELHFEQNEGPLWLRLQGPEGVREFIKEGMLAAII